MCNGGNIGGAVRRAWVVVVIAAIVISSGRVVADTVRLTTGGVIENCRIVKHDDMSVYLRTPSGPMTVPRGEVHSVTRLPSVFDTFDEYRKRLPEGDAAGRFRLASWCLETGGLRPEVNELLKEVVELQPGHDQARRLLGHVFVKGAWRRLKPLVLHVEIMQGEELSTDFSQQLTVAVQARNDVQLSDRPRKKSASGTCNLQVWLSTYTAQATRFYGRELRGAQGRAVVGLAASAEWLGKRPHTLTLEGEAPLSAPDAQQKALIDAITRNASQVHRYLDQLTQARVADVEARVQAAEKQAAGKEKESDGVATGASS